MRRVPRWIRVLALAVFLSLAAGCGSSDEPPVGDLERRLETDTGVAWVVDRDEAGAPAIVTALTPPPPLTTALPREQAAIAFLQSYADLLGAGAHGDLARELVLVADLADRWAPGAHHLRFAQRIPGSDVRVFGADTFVHLDANGAVRFIAVGFVHDLAKIGAQPATTADQARAAAEATVRARDPQATSTMPKAAQLIVLRGRDGAGRLAWRVALDAIVDGVHEAPTLVIDANTGELLAAEDGMARFDRQVEASNVYDYHPDCGQAARPRVSSVTYDDAFAVPLAPILLNRLARSGNATRSAIVTDAYLGKSGRQLFTHPIVSEDPRRFDAMTFQQGAGSGVSAHENLAIVDAFFQSLGQKGWDGTDWGSPPPEKPVPITAAVHAWELAPQDGARSGELRREVGMTAFSTTSDVIFLGDGFEAGAPHLGAPSCSALPASVALDIVGHEFTHGIAHHLAHIGLTGEAGALNEAIGDVFGAIIEHSVRPGDDNFLAGEASDLASHGRRDMRSPRARQAKFAATRGESVPRAYSERLSTDPGEDNDRGHIHDNSLIASHAFYLMAIGGTNDVTGLTVRDDEAIGWERGARLWHLTLLSADQRYVRSFHDFARVQTNLATVLAMPSPQPFPSFSVASVACAWRAVEVFTDEDLKVYGVSCSRDLPPLPPSSPSPGAGKTEPSPCAGHGDQPICDEAAPASAFVCRGGLNVGVALCAAPDQRCVRRSNADPTATIDVDGALICE